jgi:hypothetical protein
MTADNPGFADLAIREPATERGARTGGTHRYEPLHKASAAPLLGGVRASHRLDIAGRVLVAASIASLAIPKSHEGMTLVTLSRRHGLTTSSLASLIGAAVGLLILAKVCGGYRKLWADSLASHGGPLVCLAVGLGVTATLLSDGLEWMWIPAGGLILLGLILHKPYLERETGT